MKVLHLGSNEKKNSRNDLNKTEAMFVEGKQKMDSLKSYENVKMSEGNLTIWTKYRWNIEKWIMRKLKRV